MSTVLHTCSIFHYSMITSGITPDRVAVSSLLGSLQPQLASQSITSPEAQQRVTAGIVAASASNASLILAFDDTFLMMTAFSVLAFLFALFLSDPVLEKHETAERSVSATSA